MLHTDREPAAEQAAVPRGTASPVPVGIEAAIITRRRKIFNYERPETVRRAAEILCSD